MFDKNDAVAIKKVVKIEKIKLWKENKDYILNKEQKLFLYHNIECQEDHIRRMIDDGWIYEEQKKREGLYVSYMNLEENIYVPCAYFYRKIL